MIMFKKFTVYVVCSALMLSGCVTPSGNGSGAKVGPQLSSQVNQRQALLAQEARPKIDVIIPVFDPGLPEDTKTYAENHIWPELRRAEANRFAVKLKDALDATGAFGAVRVTPDNTATGDLYVLGKIVKSDGANVEIALDVMDISGKSWFSESFEHETDAGYFQNIRNKGKDPYDPVFEEAAQYLVEKLSKKDDKTLANLQSLADLRFAASFSETAFAQHLNIHGDRVELASLPSDNDPMLKRVKAIRVRDQLFVDRLQGNYQTFSHKMDDSYAMWQEQSQLEIAAEKEATSKAQGQAALGILAIGLGVLAAVSGSKSNSSAGRTAGITGAAVGGIVGATMIGKSFQTSDEAKIHRDALVELGQSVDLEMAPQVVAFEEKTVELTGDAKEQFEQWRAFLKKMYALENTPNTRL
ncbi:hypothetical protein BEN30_08250 [Magnetovibrio blakemorei]|uniref:Lipoprotein n=2 Tax=Magnetovibrio blakemorei TaxID=28181 RepID=A0A1E5Q8U8_9PROT|nr:hypothetical protein BEN30_08250 [Magnetovibrio blakemorei]